MAHCKIGVAGKCSRIEAIFLILMQGVIFYSLNIMLTSISLKCSNCGANLEITNEMSTFACGYCGASQIVERSGGTVSLKLLTTAISNVQIGTDKTAAELAINRLKDELRELEASFGNEKLKERSGANATFQRFRSIWLITCLVCLVFAVTGYWMAIFFTFLWIVTTGIILYFYGLEQKSNRMKHSVARECLINKATEIEQRILEQKKFVDT